MIAVLLLGGLAAVGWLVLSGRRRSLWFPALGFIWLGLIGMLTFAVAMEQATLAQLHNGQTPLGVAVGGVSVALALAGLAGLASLALWRRIRGGAGKGQM